MEPNPALISEKTLFDSRWLKVREMAFPLGNKIHHWTYVTRGKANKLDADAVVIVPFVRQASRTTNRGPRFKLLLIDELRYPVHNREIGLPAGLIDPQSNLNAKDRAIAAAKRELLEETGYKVTKVLAVSQPTLYSSAGMTDEAVTFVLVEAVAVGIAQPEETESIRCFLAGLPEIRSILRGSTPVSARLWPLLWAFDRAGCIKP